MILVALFIFVLSTVSRFLIRLVHGVKIEGQQMTNNVRFDSDAARSAYSSLPGTLIYGHMSIMSDQGALILPLRVVILTMVI